MKCDVSFISFSAFLVPIGLFIGAIFVPCDKAYIGVMHDSCCLFHEFEKFWLSSQHPRHCSKVRNFAGGFPSKTNLTFSWRARSQPPLWNAIGFDFWISKFEPVALERDGCGQRSATSRQIFVVMRYWVHEGSSVLIAKKCFCLFFCLFMQKSASMLIDHCENSTAIVTVNFGQLYTWASIL